MSSSSPPIIVSSFAVENDNTPILNTELKYETQEDLGARISDAVEVLEVGTNLYMSKELWVPTGARGGFGGQLVAQALRAAYKTVTDEFDIHALHSQFIIACDTNIPVLYQVQNLRDGRSYMNRYVTATQKNQLIFVCSLSFSKRNDFINLDHQIKMPQVPGPEQATSLFEKYSEALKQNDLAPIQRKFLVIRLEEVALIDFRQIEIPKPTNQQQHWFKTKGPVADDRGLHACIIAYASDMTFINAAATSNGLYPKGISMLTSLDHSMWFHSPVKADDWLLYDVESPRTSSGRGLVCGKVYTRDGKLAVTATQEGVVRLTKGEQERRRNAQNDSKI
ncbi:Thioesterase/thiol ester dehydrase-isomerase [Backusella circina FSU 941]|nr:Thioesterase/thiol ester dehydrase-isomerase [Backusella circina FSU 941]